MTRDGGFLKVYGGMGFPVEKNSRDPLDALDADSAELLDSAPFPVDALPGACRTLVREAAASIGCPPDLVALPMLVVLGTASGNARRIKLKEGWKESAAIYGAAVAPPGEKKSAAYKVAVAPAVKRQAALRNAYREKMDEYERELREWEVEKRENGRNGLPAPPPPKEPVMERTVVEDATVEALVAVQQGTPRGVLVARDELAAWLRSMDQYRAGGKGSDRQFWLSVWSNAYASVDRKGRAEPLILQSPFVGVYGSIQPGVLPELGAGREDGLLDRFLFARTDPISSRWTDDEVSVEARDAYAELYDGLRGLDMPEDEHGDPDPVRVEFSPDAKAVFVETVDGHREEMEGPGFPARLRGPWAKLEAYLARLSLILAMVRAVQDGAPEGVEAYDVLRATVLLGYFKDQARRIHVGLRRGDPDDELGKDLEEFLKGLGGTFEGEPTELHEQLKSRHKPGRPDELSRKIKAIAKRAPALEIDARNRWDGEQSRRFLRLTLKTGVKGVKGVKEQAAS